MEGLGKIWARVQMIVMVPVALGVVVLEVMDWFSPAVAAAPGMPWGQFAGILVPVLVIYAAGFYFQSKRSPQSQQAELPKPYVMSNDMRGLAKYGILIALVATCLFLPRDVMKLADGVGTREWFRSLCTLLILVIVIPTWVKWALMLWKKTPEPAA